MRLNETQGFSLPELAITLALFGLSAALLIPDLMRLWAREQVRGAALEVASVLRRARFEAIRHDANVAVRFEHQADGHYAYRLYRDGDGDGVRNADIASGVDSPLRPAVRLGRLGGGIDFGFPTGLRPRDPADPRHRLDRLDDPIRFNQSDLASFAALGTATPGSVYVTDRRRHLAVVRVLGLSGRVEVLVYDPEEDHWIGQ